MSDDRSHMGPTHIERINDWEGSGSYVQGARRDPEDIDVKSSEDKTYPYQLIEKAFHDGVMRRPGEVVYMRPSEIGPHHARLPGVEYPPDSAPSVPAFVSRAEHESVVNDLKARIALLEAQQSGPVAEEEPKKGKG